MSSKEKKLFVNMMLLIPKVKELKFIREEEFFVLYQLVDGYSKLKKYFVNSNTINELLEGKIENIKLFDLIRVVRNQYSHIDKSNATEKLVILQIKVKKETLKKLVIEICTGISDIYNKYFENDNYSLVVNSREVLNVMYLMKNYSYNENHKSEFDNKCITKLKPIFDKFKYDNSTIEEWEDFNKEVKNVFESDEIKSGLKELYGEEIYNELLAMISDENYTNEQFMNTMNKMKNIIETNKE